MPVWVRLAAWAALLCGGAYLGWTVESWREGAHRTAQAEADLTAERSAHAASERARLYLSARLAATDTTVRTEVREVVKRVPVLVPDLRACDLSEEAVSQLNRVRGYPK